MLPDHPPTEFLHRRADSLTHAAPLLQADLRTDLIEVGRSLLSELPKPELGPPINLLAWLLWLRTHTVPFVSTWRFVSIPIHANERTKSTWHTPRLRDTRSTPTRRRYIANVADTGRRNRTFACRFRAGCSAIELSLTGRRLDSNQRPRGYEPHALPLSYAPKREAEGGRMKDEENADFIYFILLP